MLRFRLAAAASAVFAVAGSSAAQSPIAPPVFLPASPTPIATSTVSTAPNPVSASSLSPIAAPASVPQMAPLSASAPSHSTASAPAMVDLTPPGLFESSAHGAGHSGHSEEGKHQTQVQPAGFFVSADLLIWRPRLGGMDFAILDPRADLTPMGQVRSLAHDVNGGFRTNLGYRFHEGWDVGFVYTYFHSSANDSLGAGPGGLLYPTKTRPGIVDTATQAQAESGINYNTYDLEFGRSWRVDESLVLRGIGGIRYASIDTDATYRYDGRQASQAMVMTQSGFEGAGPMAGLEARWTCTEAFHLFGNSRGGLLYGDYRSSFRETNGNGLLVNSDVSDTFTGVAPFAAVVLGAEYRWGNFSLAAGYEVTHWFGVSNQVRHADDFADGKVDRQKNDLSFDGVFFRLGIGF